VAPVAMLMGLVLSVVFAASSHAALPETKIAGLFSRRTLPEPLVPVGSGVSEKDCDRLVAALDAFEKRGQSDDFSLLENYLQANPKSPWRLAVWTNLGLLQYRAGYFSRCIVSFHSAWNAGKGATEVRSKALADRAAGEYARMLARLGRYSELKAFLGEVGGRKLIGAATELMLASRESAATMETQPDVAFRCGPLALSRILASAGSSLWASPLITESKLALQGTSLAQLTELSGQLGMNYQPARRSPGAPLIFPSLIHWKVGHYAALLRMDGDRYLSQDPTFENQIWHSQQALESEASGYFLVPPGPLPDGWSAVSPTEAGKVFGTGDTNGPDPDPDPGDGGSPPEPPPSPSPNPTPSPSPNPSPTATPCPMAISFFRLQLTSLQIEDTPVGYQPPYGPGTYFKVTYIQRDPTQPSNFNYSNLGPKWNFNWQSHIVDDPGNPANVSLVPIGGGRIKYIYSGSSGGYHNFATQFSTYTQLRRPVDAVSYEVTNPDGSKDIYAKSDGSTVSPRRVFLSQRIDPAGNAISLTYDAQLRLTQITDSVGQNTSLSYEQPGDAFKITKVTDPFGRFASFFYDGSGRLTRIRDVIGIESAFSYQGSTDFIESLTTPYGTTTFTKTENGAFRRLTATDPQGNTQVLETNGSSTAAISPSEPVAPQGMLVTNNYLNYRNSFYWNKKQWKEAPNDYGAAHIYHWLHDFNFSKMSHFLESEKEPLQSRIWYGYSGQTEGHIVGRQSTPAFIGRVIEGGTQLTRHDITTLGKVSRETDPLGRLTTYNYSADGIDLTSVTHGPDMSHIAINVGGGPVGIFGSDQGGSGGNPYSTTHSIDVSAVTNPAPEAVYQTGRYSSDFTYTFSGLGAGANCTIRLHFAETNFNSAGQRVFNVLVNGSTQITGLDVYVAAGNQSNKALIREINTAADANGTIAIRFVSTVENAIISGIEILNPSAPAPPVLFAYTYNAQHRPLTYTDAAGQVTNYAWNPTGQISSVTNAKQETTAFSYYPANATGHQRKGRLEKIDGALPGSADTVTFDYDATGNIGKTTGPDGYFLDLAYDALNRLTRVTFPDATYTETVYDRLDPLTSRDRLGRITRFTHNSLRQLTSVTDPAQRTIRYDYCGCGDLDQLIDPMDRITTWRHDIAGRITAKVYADGSTIRYAYEPLSGRLSMITDEKSQVKTRTYNLDDTLAGIAYTHAEHSTPNVAFTYDAEFRRIKRMIDGIGTTLYTYYPIASGTLGAGQIASVDGPLPNDTLTYGYDELGRDTSYAINGVGEVRTFDPLGRLLSAVNPVGIFGYTYVGATSRMETVSYPNGMTCQYNYHPLTGDFRLKDIIHTVSGNTMLSRHSYEYTSVGNITRWTQISPQAGLNRSWLCDYNDADELISVASQDPITFVNLPTGQYVYTYNPAANRLSETIDGVATAANYNALNELISLTTGGVSSLPEQTYEWDAEDRLVAINYTGTSRRSEFHYDGDGLMRIAVEIEEGVTMASHRFVWTDDLQIAEQRDATGANVEKRYFDWSMEVAEGGGVLAPRMLARDHLGSVRSSISDSSTITGAFDFDPWGRRSQIVAQIDEPNLGFAGKWHHSASNFLLAPFRVYNVSIGRWLSRDPFSRSEQSSDGPNLYSYVRNDPIDLWDPYGTESEHTKNKSPSNKARHEKGQARKGRDRWEKGDERRPRPKKRPKGWLGPWFGLPWILPPGFDAILNNSLNEFLPPKPELPPNPDGSCPPGYILFDCKCIDSRFGA
jgi:RHS repeat-associated protein